MLVVYTLSVAHMQIIIMLVGMMQDKTKMSAPMINVKKLQILST